MPLKGREWIQILGASISGFCILSLEYNGHLLVEDLRELFNFSYEQVSLVPALWSASAYMGFMPAFLFRHVGIRITMTVASIGLCLSFAAASFASSHWLIMILLCAVASPLIGIQGAGNHFALNEALSAEHFHLAESVSSSISAFGILVMPLLYEVMLKFYTFRGTLLLIGAIMLHNLFAASVMPNRKSKKSTTISIRGWKQLLQDQNFYIMHLIFFLEGLSFNAYNGFATSLYVKEFGLSRPTTFLLLSVTNGLGLLGRFLVFFLNNNSCHFSRYSVLQALMLIQGSVVLLLGILESVPLFFCYALGATFWVCASAVFTLEIIVTEDLFSGNFDLAYSTVLMSGCASMMLTPIAVGVTVDRFHSFQKALIIAGGVKVLGMLFIIGWRTWISRCRSQDTEFDRKPIATVNT